ncbi:MAG: hypothetical protein MUE82_01820, partial [Chloroflexi bacterium]|nr:hypothetical protein [Chloroflexota bacterium]
MRRHVRRRSRLVALFAAAALCISIGAAAPAAATGAVHAAADIDVVGVATGGDHILSTTARIGGTGAWTQLHGPRLGEFAVGDFVLGMKIGLLLPENVEWNADRTTRPGINHCRLSVAEVEYPSARLATIRLGLLLGGPADVRCRVDFGEILQVRPVENRRSEPGGPSWLTVEYWTHAMFPTQIAESAGTVFVVAPPPTAIPATGGAAIASTTARIGGDGTWTRLTGPRFSEVAHDGVPPGFYLDLVLPSNFEWNTANTAPPSVSDCDRTIHAIAYPAPRIARGVMVVRPGMAGSMALCTIDFGTLLQVRPIDASATVGSSGDLTGRIAPEGFGSAMMLTGLGSIAMVTAPPPPVDLSLAAVAPTAINGAILWGEGVDLVTTGPAGTGFSLQVTTDMETWQTLADAAGAPLAFTIGGDGTSTYRYRPVRNYWYRAVAGTATSPAPYPRVTVRQTIVIRPIHTGTRRVSAGTAVTFTATIRPAGPALPIASVRFELYRRTGSHWVLSRSVAVAVDISGVAATTFTFARGSWYVRAQSQPTRVNANSL